MGSGGYQQFTVAQGGDAAKLHTKLTRRVKIEGMTERCRKEWWHLLDQKGSPCKWLETPHDSVWRNHREKLSKLKTIERARNDNNRERKKKLVNAVSHAT